MDILISYAQEREDIILFHLLKKVGGSNIRWIDIGANDPVEISVTKLFSTMGGTGINVEPQKLYFDLLMQDRPNDININVGVGEKTGELKLRGEGAGATFDPAISVENEEKCVMVPIVTLSQICEEFINPNEDTHFLKVDVEGWEKDVLLGMDFKKFRPWIVCMEAAIPSTDTPCYDEWEYIMTDNGYVLLGAETINRYYVAEERKNEINSYLSKDEVCKEYDIVNYSIYKNDKKMLGTFVFRAMRWLYYMLNR